jgi:UDP-galactopyranose mutase
LLNTLLPNVKVMPDYLVVGAGFSGAVLAERIAQHLGKTVLLIDKRDHIGGNAYDYYDSHGILVHKYGPHIFHTNSRRVFEYLSHFTTWRRYEHRVMANIEGQLVPFPVNLETVRRLCGIRGNTGEIARWVESLAQPAARVRNAEDFIVGKVGRYLYDTLFRGYTLKQWGVEAGQLSPAVTARVAPRLTEEDRYFTDTYQVMPSGGYTELFRSMLSHKNITIALQTSYSDLRTLPRIHTFYTGPIDEFFRFRFGRLSYRSLRFVHRTFDRKQFQPVGVVTFPGPEAYTRITEFRHLTGQVHPKTSISYEFPEAAGDPFYPMPTDENSSLYEVYRRAAILNPAITFAGRLGTYKYLNMDQVVGQSLSLFDAHLKGQLRCQ